MNTPTGPPFNPLEFLVYAVLVSVGLLWVWGTVQLLASH